jgi:ribose-phosphate pyrophosphokinase
MLSRAKIFAGNSNVSLAKRVANRLQLPLGNAEIARFSDGEIRVEINEPVRGDTVFVFQSTCAPVNDNIMEMLILIDAIRRSHSKRIVAVIPYFGYARQDRRPGFFRTPITARLIADMIEAAGVEYVITVDIHSQQQQGFFHIPTTNISASVEIVADIWRNNSFLDDLVIVSPDTGGVARARTVSKQLEDIELAIVDKRRTGVNKVKVMHVIGNVEGKNCIIIDDMIDTAGTLTKAAQALKEAGANKISAYAAHGVFSGPAYDNINESVLDEVVITDTIPIDTYKSSKIRVLSLANVLAETMLRIKSHQSVSQLYAGG